MVEFEQEAHQLVSAFKDIYKSALRQQVLGAYSEMAVLSVLGHQAEIHEPIMPSVIAQKAGLSPARVAALLKSLEKKGYVSRDMDPNDRRKISVKITDAGKAKRSSQTEHAFGTLASILAKMGQEEVDKLLESVTLFHDISNEMAKEVKQRQLVVDVNQGITKKNEKKEEQNG